MRDRKAGLGFSLTEETSHISESRAGETVPDAIASANRRPQAAREEESRPHRPGALPVFRHSCQRIAELLPEALYFFLLPICDSAHAHASDGVERVVIFFPNPPIHDEFPVRLRLQGNTARSPFVRRLSPCGEETSGSVSPRRGLRAQPRSDLRNRLSQLRRLEDPTSGSFRGARGLLPQRHKGTRRLRGEGGVFGGEQRGQRG